MVTRALALALLMLSTAAFSDEARISVGMSHDDAVALIQKISGTDITPGMEVVGPKGEHPLAGIYWEFKNYDGIIALATKDGKIAGITYWTKKDFGESKIRREKTALAIRTLKIDTTTGKVSIEKKT